MNYHEELITLLALPTGDRDHAAELVAKMSRGELRLPPCFRLRGRSEVETARVHELARLIVAS